MSIFNTKNRCGNIVLVGIFTLIAKFVAIFRQIVLTFYFGASEVSDAYILAQSIPNTLFMIVVSAVGVSYIPVYLKAEKENGTEVAREFTSRLINIIIVIASLVVVVTLIFAKQIVFLFASGFSSETAEIAVKFLKVSIFSVYFIGMVGVYTAYLKANSQFFYPSFIGVALSVVEILACVIAAKTNNIFLAIGIIVATFFQFVIVLFAAIRSGYHWNFSVGFFDKYIKQVVFLSIPIFISYGIDEINVIIDKTLASGFDVGSISALTYSSTLVAVFHNIITVSTYTVLFSEVSQLAVQNNIREISIKIQKMLQGVLFLLIPLTFGIVVFSNPIIQILFQRGSFDFHATNITALSFALYALSLVPNGIRMLTQTYFYAYGKTKFCMSVGIVAVIVNIGCNIAFSRAIGVGGLALASSFAIFIAACLHFFAFCKNNPWFNKKKFLISLMTVVGNSTCMIICALVMYKFMKTYVLILPALICAVIFAMIVYFILSYLTKTMDRELFKIVVHRRR